MKKNKQFEEDFKNKLLSTSAFENIKKDTGEASELILSKKTNKLEKFKISIIESLLLIILSILIPLVSHFIGIIINLKYPKFDWDSSSEVVKQSTSSFISVMIGMILLVMSVFIIMSLIDKISAILILIMGVVFYLILDTLLYIYLMKKGIKLFNNL